MLGQSSLGGDFQSKLVFFSEITLPRSVRAGIMLRAVDRTTFDPRLLISSGVANLAQSGEGISMRSGDPSGDYRVWALVFELTNVIVWQGGSRLPVRGDRGKELFGEERTWRTASKPLLPPPRFSSRR